MPLTDVAVVEFTAIPPLAPGTPILPTWLFLVQNNATGEVWRATSAQAQAALVPPVAAALPAPVLAFVSPAQGSSLPIGQPVLLQLTAAAVGGIAQVECFANGVPLGLASATGNTYTLAYTPTAGVTLNLSAVATAVNGQLARNGVFVQLTAPPEAVPPAVAFLTPAFGATLTVGTPTLLQATVTATAPALITGVEFFANGTSLGVGARNGNVYFLAYTPAPGGTVNLSVTATATGNIRATASSFALLAAPVSVAPPGPTFTNYQDTVAGGSVQLVPFAGIPFTDHQYKIGDAGVYAQLPADGLITVGNVVAQVFAYSIETATRPRSSTSASVAFTAATVSAPPVVSFLTPGYGSSVQVGTVLLLRASAVSPVGIAQVEFFANGASLGLGTLNADAYFLPYTVVSGSTLNFSVTATTLGAAKSSASTFVFITAVPASTVYTGTYTTTAADYTTACGTGTGLAVTRTANSATSQDAANAAARSAAIAAIVCQAAPVATTYYSGPSTSNAPSPAMVQGLTASTGGPGPRTLSFNCTNTFPTYAEVASNGNRPVILDKNGFDVTGDIIKVAMVLNGLAYNTYTHANPQFDAAFILKFL